MRSTAIATMLVALIACGKSAPAPEAFLATSSCQPMSLDECRNPASIAGSARYPLPPGFHRRTIDSRFAVPWRLDDRDHDGLIDSEEQLLGTRPDDPDSDHDGFPDSWEVRVVDGFDFNANGASPLHRDVFVKMDYMCNEDTVCGLRGNADVIDQIVDAFRQAPLDNPDGTRGIALHLVWGSEVVFQDSLLPRGPSFAALRRHALTGSLGRIPPVFHYMVWANGTGNTMFSGEAVAERGGAEFIVTLGRWNNLRGGNDNQKVGAFVHELGHNLGLAHGGNWRCTAGNSTCSQSPNHLSVMNYLFQAGRPLAAGGYDFGYQAAPTIHLDERHLVDANGIGHAAALASYRTLWFDKDGYEHNAIAGGPIGWNSEAGAADLNGDGELSDLVEEPDEWAALDYTCKGMIGWKQTHQGATGPFLINDLDAYRVNLLGLPIETLTEAQAIRNARVLGLSPAMP